MVNTTIQISQDLQNALNNKKLFLKETYEEIIWNLLEDTIQLSEETKKDIKEGREQIKRGESLSLEQVKKRYHL
ncbi:hypothetical protein HYZ97_04310 [Candidatus Pacearchaeota archaeon]|nr:hypothetical protein [Candidatus Pacearchaeota archaeon]